MQAFIKKSSINAIEKDIQLGKQSVFANVARWPAHVFKDQLIPRTAMPLLNQPLLAFERTGSTMSNRTLQISPSVDEIKLQWKGLLEAAAVAWGELTAAELVQVEGHKRRLIALIQMRYVITRHEAEMQVQYFFDQHTS